MNKVVAKDFRTVKSFTLPISGVTLSCYSSILVGDLNEVNAKKDPMEVNVLVILRTIKEWNFYAKEEDTEPLAITAENFNKLPAPDLQYLLKELEVFSAEQKKS